MQGCNSPRPRFSDFSSPWRGRRLRLRRGARIDAAEPAVAAGLPHAPATTIGGPAGAAEVRPGGAARSPGRIVKARERVVFTNRSKVPVTELIFHVYPRYQVPEKDRIKLAKTMEVLRLSPEEALDASGRRMDVLRVFVGNQPRPVRVRSQGWHDPGRPARPPGPAGGTAVAAIDFTVELPEKWGRWGELPGGDLPPELVSGAGPSRRQGMGADAVRPLAPALVPGGRTLQRCRRPARRPGCRLVGPDHGRQPGPAGGSGSRSRPARARFRARLLESVPDLGADRGRPRFASSASRSTRATPGAPWITPAR